MTVLFQVECGEEILSLVAGGYRLYRFKSHPEGIVVRIEEDVDADGPAAKFVRIGQLVKASGLDNNFPRGITGIVIAINIPLEGGRSSDVIEVRFEGTLHAHYVKFKDLQL